MGSAGYSSCAIMTVAPLVLKTMVLSAVLTESVGILQSSLSALSTVLGSNWVLLLTSTVPETIRWSLVWEKTGFRMVRKSRGIGKKRIFICVESDQIQGKGNGQWRRKLPKLACGQGCF